MAQTLKQLQNGELNGATSLKLSEGLSQFPREVFQLAATLEILDLSRNNLTALPPDFGRLRKLRILFCSENSFTALPEVLADCPLLDIVGFKANKIQRVPARSLNPHLRWLILTDNRITELPDAIGNCARMQKLMLAGNQLTALPQELIRCRNLSLLRISANRLPELPRWLLSMPRLSWLAFSGNGFSKSVARPIPLISWDKLHIREVLGEGASGIICKADWHGGTEPQQVAVKIFKGTVTSDGLPDDELNACIAAGTHEGLVPVTGQITGHPENRKGLVMGLIPARFSNLGLPPTFESCTRDVFAPGASLTAAQALKIAGTIASVAAQLHSQGIMHGDMYAHNILTDDEGNTLFGDFGAACFYDREHPETAGAMERIEVSAFGCLLEDLLGLCGEASANSKLLQLAALKDACIAPEISSRPDFEYLLEALSRL